MGIISEMLSYPFMVRALIGGLLVSLCASLLGVSLVDIRVAGLGVGVCGVWVGWGRGWRARRGRLRRPPGGRV